MTCPYEPELLQGAERRDGEDRVQCMGSVIGGQRTTTRARSQGTTLERAECEPMGCNDSCGYDISSVSGLEEIHLDLHADESPTRTPISTSNPHCANAQASHAIRSRDFRSGLLWRASVQAGQRGLLEPFEFAREFEGVDRRPSCWMGSLGLGSEVWV